MNSYRWVFRLLDMARIDSNAPALRAALANGELTAFQVRVEGFPTCPLGFQMLPVARSVWRPHTALKFIERYTSNIKDPASIFSEKNALVVRTSGAEFRKQGRTPACAQVGGNCRVCLLVLL